MILTSSKCCVWDEGAIRHPTAMKQQASVIVVRKQLCSAGRQALKLNCVQSMVLRQSFLCLLLCSRRRSMDSRNNGASKDSSWHGAESVEAAVAILNDL